MLEHGGRLHQAAARYGIALADWLDLSAAINPAPWPAPALPDTIWQRLPDNDDAVHAAAARYYFANNCSANNGLDGNSRNDEAGCSQLLATAGSQSSIGWLPWLRAKGTALVFEPGYAEHMANWQAAGHTVITRPVAMRAAVLERIIAGDEPAPDVIVIINPHNPTGDTLPRELLLRLHARMAGSNGWLVIDEAFADGGAAQSCIPHHCGQMPQGLIVLRSLGKFFGLPGLRCGFTFACPDLLQSLRERAGPWPLSTAAHYLLPLVYADHDWQAASATQLAVASAQLRQQLQMLRLPLTAGTSLFQTVDCGDAAHAAALQQRFAQQGILVRHYAASPLLRCGLPATSQQWQRLEQTIRLLAP